MTEDAPRESVPEAAAESPPASPPAESTADSTARGDSTAEAVIDPDAVFDEVVAPDPQANGARPALIAFAFALAVASLFGMIAASGIWEPYELNIADLARRIAVVLLGGKQLVIDGATNAVPTSGELGKGELPFTCVAVGLRLFGLNEWAGRLPLALWAFLGVVAMYFLLARLVDRVAAAFAVIALSTMPLYFLGARTILGDVVTMAALSVAVSGLAIAVFDDRPRTAARCGWAIFGVLGLAAGFGARGALFGVALPTFAVGSAFLVRGRASTDRLGGIFATLSLVLGVVAVVLGLRALFKAEDHQLVRLLGAVVDRHRTYQAHDAMILELGHSLFPWSAVVPFALGRLLRPPVGVVGSELERESSARVTLLLVSVLCFGAYTALAPTLGVLPYSGAFALAAATGIMLRDFERGAPGSRTVALGVAALVVLFLTDFKNFPEKGLSAFVVDGPKFPDSFKDQGMRILELGGLASAALFGLFFLERDEGQKVFDREEHRRFYRSLRASYEGNVAFGLLALEVALVALAIATVVSDKYTHWQQIETMAVPARQAAKYGYLLLPVLVLAPSLVMIARDACRMLLRKLRTSRATAAMLALGAFGATLSFGYYPLLARQMSPKEVFESYQRLARPGEHLAMMGSGAGSAAARYYAHGDVRVFAGAQEAFNWLVANDLERRWLVVRSADFGQMNAQFRSRRVQVIDPHTNEALPVASGPAKNIPVLDSRSSEILLVSNQLRPGETNANPLTKWVLDERPTPARKLDVDFNGQLHCIGWDVTTPDGAHVTSVRAGKPYVFHFYYEVTRPISGEWQTFIHVDGYQRRYNGDHDTLEGKYPFHLWHVGDYIEDRHTFELEPNFTAGTYTVFFGLFRGDARLEVKRPVVEDNRVNAGPLEVR